MTREKRKGKRGTWARGTRASHVVNEPGAKRRATHASPGRSPGITRATVVNEPGAKRRATQEERTRVILPKHRPHPYPRRIGLYSESRILFCGRNHRDKFAFTQRMRSPMSIVVARRKSVCTRALSAGGCDTASDSLRVSRRSSSCAALRFAPGSRNPWGAPLPGLRPGLTCAALRSAPGSSCRPSLRSGLC